MFTITTIAFVWAAGFLSPLFPSGLTAAGTSGPMAFRLAFFWQGVIALCALGAFASWWQFTRLEAIEGPGQEVHLPFWTATSGEAAAAPHSAFWEVVKKELRIQQLTIVVGGIYGIGWFATGLLGRYFPDSIDLSPGALTLLYGPLLALLAGSLASAEERQLGTLEWQLLLPMAVWKQWFAKVGVALALALLLGLGLPVLVAWISPIHPGSSTGRIARRARCPPDDGRTLRIVVLTKRRARLARVAARRLWTDAIRHARDWSVSRCDARRPVPHARRRGPVVGPGVDAHVHQARACGDDSPRRDGIRGRRARCRTRQPPFSGTRRGRLWKQGCWILGGVFVGAAVLALCVTAGRRAHWLTGRPS